MSSSTPPSPPAAPGSGGIPAIRTFQMDSGGIGSMSSSVNLFRGDVNLNQTLFTLPGRTQDNGLDVNLSIQYQSNVHRQATTWNRDAPTGVLGLGWSFPLTYIEAEDGGSPVPATRRYTLYDNGSPNGLARQPRKPLLFELPADLGVALRDGQPVPDGVLQAFRRHGLAVDAAATVSGTGPWTVSDDALQQLFTLAPVDGAIGVYDGGELYQLRNYLFWKVLYYPPYERWLVVTDTGVRRSFGGIAPLTPEGYRTSVANSVAWGVWWSDGAGLPTWSGPSTQTGGQQQVARAWYLASVTDRFGSSVTYGYNGWARDDHGLIPGAEQLVGAGGLPFTKAVYLTGTTDVFGRTVTLSYGDKLWGAGDADPREYADPHRAVPSNDPGPYQDRYETRYLDEVVVDAPSGDRLFSVRMSYVPRPEVSGPGRAVANVTGSTGRLLGDTCKRYLTGVTLFDQDGVAQPGIELRYFLDPEALHASPGALAGVTYPEGGTASYAYQRQELDVCQRTVEVRRPAEVAEGASPRVYFGPDYAVVCYYSQSRTQLSFQVFTWAGSWLSWQLDPDEAVLDDRGLDLATLEVLADQDFLALHFDRLEEKVVYVFQRDVAQPGQWKPATVDGRTAAKNTPSLTYPTSGAEVAFAGGDTFFVVSQMDKATLAGRYDVVTFRWTTTAWTRQTVDTSEYTWLTAAHEHYVTLGASGRLVVHSLDGDLDWQASAPATVAGLTTVDPAGVALVPGAGLVAISNLTSQNAQQNTYRVWIAQWNAGYGVTVGAFGPFTDEFGMGNAPTPWAPQVVRDDLVAISGNLLRFNGETWLLNEGLKGVVPSHETVRYAYGPDYALQILASTQGAGASALVLSFDPALDSASWDRAPAAPRQELPPQSSSRDNWPTSGGADYLVVGPYLYVRGTSSNWEDVVARDALADLGTLSGAGDHFDSESLVNEGPSFLSYTARSWSQEVQAVLLANGLVLGNPVPLHGQRMVTPGQDGIAGPGVSPAGPQVFVTYPADAISFDSAGSIFLHRYTDSAVSGPVVHYAVAGLVLEDGYQEPMCTTYVPDPLSAGCDPAGQVVKYYRSTAYPGTSDPKDARYGWATSFYLNGLEYLTGDNYYDMLDGLLVRTETYDRDGALKERVSTTYAVYPKVALDPADPASDPLQLRGAWVAPVRREHLDNGLTTVQATSYVPALGSLPSTGQPVEVTTASRGGDGKLQSFGQRTSYGVEFDAALRAIHALTDPAQQTSTLAADGAAPIPLRAVATTYRPWASALGQGVEAPAPEATFGLLDAADSRFPYGTCQRGQTPPGWQLVARTTERTVYGQERESLDSLGIPTATLYSSDSRFAVAQVPNAPRSGMAYLGFQAYEDTAGWTLEGVAYDADDARTGTRAAVLPAGTGASVSATVSARAGFTYVAGCWLKTPVGFVSGAAAGWTVVVGVNGVRRAPVFEPFPLTDGEWAYRTIPIAPILMEGAGEAQIELTAANASGHDVLLDSLLLVPLVNGLTARTFDDRTHQVTATMDAGGRTSRTFYDRAGRPTVSVGASGRVQELAQRFLSRAGSADGGFQPSSPNAELTLHPAGGGHLETFRDGGAWKARWRASNLTDHWVAGDGRLTHTGTATDTLTWVGPAPQGTYAVYFEMQATGQPEVSISVGDVTVGYAGNRYAGRQGGVEWTALVQPPNLARHWLVAVGDGVVLLFADGQLLFTEKARPAGRDVAITTGGATATLRHLALVDGIRIGLSYNDAAARQRQVHQLHWDDSIVAETIFDALGRQVATTRNAPGSFGTGAHLGVLQYSPKFVDVDAFLAGMETTWEMKGDVAGYYRGQPDGPVRRSDDQGYPYRGIRYEDSPRSLQLEAGRPGKPYAIDLTVAAADRQTVQYAWGTNAADAAGLPPGDYARTTMTSPLKTQSTQLTDRMGQLVAAHYADVQGVQVSRTNGNRTYADGPAGPQATLVNELPNATTPGPQSDQAGYRRVSTTDAFQRPTTLVDPDAGETGFVFDSAGRLRFVQPALDPGEAWFVYYRYDPLGRLVEEGTVAGVWDRTVLAQRADDPSFPADGTVSVATSYDGSGADPALIGSKWRTTSSNPAPASDPGAGDTTVTETFGYDPSGQLTSVRMQLEGPVAADGVVGYEYDTLGEVRRVDLPEGAPQASIFYSYDDLGHVVGVGTAADRADLGAYTYTPDGSVQVETLADGAWLRSFSYASPGWVLSIETRSAAGDQGLDLAYTYEADSAVRSRRAAFSFLDASDTFDETVAYDEQRRLRSATGTRSLTITEYDPNGNIWAQEQDGVHLTAPCRPGSDRLDRVTVGSESSQVCYNARGQMTAGLGRTLTYDDCTGMTTSIRTDSAAIRLAYGGSQQRVLKQVREGAGEGVVSFWGAGQFPVARLEAGRWSVLAQGPQGLLAVISDRRLFPLKDATRSTWAVVDDESLLARYAYLPFGQHAVAEDPNGVGFPYRYQGQEWDAEVGLYNFRARMYDAVLSRFLAPDPARQFASAYVFAGNDPLSAIDPTGDISLWAQVGIGAAMVAVTAIGVGLTVLSGGASDAAAAGADAALIGAGAGVEAGVEGAALAASESAAGAAEELTVAGVAEGVSAGADGIAGGGASEIAAGSSVAEAAAGGAGGSGGGAAAGAASWTAPLKSLGWNALGSTVSGAGTSGLTYDYQHGRDFTAQGFFEAVGIGAAGGLVNGLLGGAGGLAAKTATAGLKGWTGIGTRVASEAAAGAISGAASSDVSTVLTNLVQHQPWSQGLLKSTGWGLAKGAGIGAVSSSFGQRADIGSELVKSGRVSAQRMLQFTTMVERLQARATSQDAYMIYGTAAYFLVSGYVVWGAADLSSSSS